MHRFIIDENLPYRFKLWNNEDFIHVYDIDEIKSDSDIWQYAKRKNLTIVTKDTDFSLKIMYNTPPPKVIHLRFGNLKMQQFHSLLNKIWHNIESEIESHKLVNVFVDRIEAIG